MRFWLKMTIPAAALAAAAWGAPAPCASGTYATYEALGATGCTVGNELFSNFGTLSFSGTIGETFPDTDLVVTPQVAGNVDELVFTYQNLPAGNPSSTVAGVSANQILGYSFLYVVTPLPNPVVDFQMTTDIGNTGNANVSAVKETDAGGTILQSSANNGASDFTFPALLSGPVTSISGTAAFDVQDAISLQGQNGTAEQLDYTNLFTEGTVSGVPEPAMTLLIGSGLLCLGMVRKYRARGR